MTTGKTKEDFDRLLSEAIDSSLTEIFGKTTAQSVRFYIDPSIAVADAGNYARSLERLFGIGSKRVLDDILSKLSQETGIAKTMSPSFADAVAEFRLSFEKRDS